MSTVKNKKLEQKSQKAKAGFSVVEGLLMLIIAAIIIFVAWYVYASTKYSDTTLNSTIKIDSSNPKFVKLQKGTTKQTASQQ
jgi:hypothetical protein